MARTSADIKQLVDEAIDYTTKAETADEMRRAGFKYSEVDLYEQWLLIEELRATRFREISRRQRVAREDQPF